MSIKSLPSHENHESSLAACLLIGVPVLLAAMALCAWIAWATHGFSSELAPNGWFSHGIVYLFGIVFYGGAEVVFGGAVLLILGVIATVLGRSAIEGWRRVRQHRK
ncbi:MAG TPA: hypothetical protein VN039_13425 [Nitrospira sp.]|nr:hypothetical protein [Nitrospira sp.]